MVEGIGGAAPYWEERLMRDILQQRRLQRALYPGLSSMEMQTLGMLCVAFAAVSRISEIADLGGIGVNSLSRRKSTYFQMDLIGVYSYLELIV